MSTSSVSGTDWWISPTTTSTTSTTSNSSSNEINFDDFLQLLVTELQNQDPTEPVSNTEYVSQMAQISSMQQIGAISECVSSYQAYSLLGKTVCYQTYDSSGNTTTETGTVESVVRSNNTTYLSVNNTLIGLDSLLEVAS